MNRKLTQLAERRRQLVAQAAAQRTALAHELAPWRVRLARVDQGVGVFRSVARHPLLLVGAALLLLVWHPRNAGKWLQRGWLAWQIRCRLRKD